MWKTTLDKLKAEITAKIANDTKDILQSSVSQTFLKWGPLL
jgi:hypothetical protein